MKRKKLLKKLGEAGCQKGKRSYMTVDDKRKVLLVAGARPNFMKIAPIYRASLAVPEVDCRIVHTGQHYDREMSQSFFDDLEIPTPAFFLEAGSGSHAVQTGKIMVAFEEACEKERPDLVIVVGKRQRSEVGGQRTEGGCQRTEDGCQRSEGRSRKADVRGRRAEDRDQTSEIREKIDVGGKG